MSGRSTPSPVPFQTTRWSLVLTAGKRPSAEADQAFAELSERYWYPVYSYIRRQFGNADQALDSTQEFFLRMLERNTVAAASSERGRFRTFLLTSCQNFLRNEWRSQRAAKRGGGRQPLPLGAENAEARYLAHAIDTNTPEREYERAWALTVLQGALDGLASEYAQAGKGDLFAALQPTLTIANQTAGYESLGKTLGLSTGAVKVAAHRLRQRYRDAVRRSIAATVRDDSDVDDELSALIEALG